MCKKKYIFLVLAVMFAGCGRQSMAPVEIKVDDNGDIVGYEHQGPGEPTYGVTEPSESDPNVYAVKHGETLFDIAYRFDLDALVLARVNGIVYPYTVHEGQKLRIPEKTDAAEIAGEGQREKVLILDDEKPEKKAVSEGKSEEKSGEQVDSSVEKDFSAMLAAVTKGKPGKGSGSAEKTSEKSAEKPDESEMKSSFNDQEEAFSAPKIKPAEKKSSEAEGKSEKPKKKPAADGSGWVLPVNGAVISNYGDVADGESNDGIDIKAAEGTPVKAACGGEVIFAGEGDKLSPSFGKTVIINHGKDTLSSYMHLKSINVKARDKVQAGQVIGTVGRTGNVNEPQLHFEVTKGEDLNPVNPSKYVKF